MTLDEIAYNILNLLRKGRSSNDELISIEQLKFNIKHYRAMYIRRDYARNGYVSNSLEQDLGCLELEKVDASKCCNLPQEYTSGHSKYYVIDDYIYVYNPNGLEAINIRGVFEDPETVANFATCTEGPCYDDQSPFPLPMDMVSIITAGLAAGELSILATGVNDTSNDRQQDKQ